MSHNNGYSAVILAAGMGSRLAPLTNEIPKCLVPVGGKPILVHQIDAFRQCGIKNVLVIAGYKAERVGNELNGCGRLVVNSQFRSTNNMYSLSLAMPYLTGSSIVVNGDVVFDGSILTDLLRAPFPNLIAVDRSRYLAESMKVVVQEGRITDISKSIPQDKAFGCSIDLYRFSPAAIEQLKKIVGGFLARGEYTHWTEVGIKELFSTCEVRPFDIRGRQWTEIDNWDDLREAQLAWSQKDF